MGKIHKFLYQIDIEIDETEVFNKYLNYKYNWESPKELADNIAFSVENEGGCDMSKDGMESYGYSIKVTEL